MNAEWKKKWVEALRSGEYKQGEGQLRYGGEDSRKYCCLGVLCDLYQKENEEWSWTEGGQVSGPKREYGGWLPFPIAQELNIPTQIPPAAMNTGKVILPKDGDRLDVLNDKEGLSFNEIANLIEEQL